MANKSKFEEELKKSAQAAAENKRKTASGSPLKTTSKQITSSEKNFSKSMATAANDILGKEEAARRLTNSYNTANENTSYFKRSYGGTWGRPGASSSTLQQNNKRISDKLDFHKDVLGESAVSKMKERLDLSEYNALNKKYQYASEAEYQKDKIGWLGDDTDDNNTADKIAARLGYRNDLQKQLEKYTYMYGKGRTREEKDEAKRRMEEIQSQMNLYDRTQATKDKYASIDSSSDFQARSYRGTYQDDKLGEFLDNKDGGNDLSGIMGAGGDYAMLGIEDDAARKSLKVSSGRSKGWDALTDQEINRYYYLMNTQGSSAAYQYLDDMQETLNKRQQTTYAEDGGTYDDDLSHQNALIQLAMSAASVPMKSVGGIMDVANTAVGLVKGNYNPYNEKTGGNFLADTIRSKQAEYLDKLAGGRKIPGLEFGLGELYQSVMSSADSRIGAMLFGPYYTYVMGATAASSKIKELYEKGADPSQMVIGGIASGIVEKLTEDVSVENALTKANPTTKRQIGINMLKQAISEGQEEGASTILNLLIDQGNMGSLSDWEQWENELDENGNKKGWKYALERSFFSVLSDALGGFISGGLLEGVDSTITYNQNRSLFANVGSEAVRNGASDKSFNIGMQINEDGNLEKNEQKSMSRAEEAMKKIADDAARKNMSVQEYAAAYNPTDENGRPIKKKLTMDEKVQRMTDRKNFADVGSYLDTLQNHFSSKAMESEIQSYLEEKEGKYDKKLAKEIDQYIYAKEHKGYAFVSKKARQIANDLMNDNEFMGRVNDKSRLDSYNAVTDKNFETVEEMHKYERKSLYGSDAYMKDGDNQVDIKVVNVANTDPKNRQVTLEDGSTVMFKDVHFADNATAFLYDTVMRKGMSTQTANQFITAVMENADSELGDFVRGASDAFNRGYNNLGLDAEIKDSFLENISRTQAEFFYKMGQDEVGVRSSESQAKRDLRKADDTGRKGRIFHMEKYTDLDPVRKRSLQVLRTVMETAGSGNIYLYKTELVDGRLVPDVTIPGWEVGTAPPNGITVTETGDVYIDVNSGNKLQGAFLYTASHEFVHAIAAENYDLYKELEDAMFGEYIAHGESVDSHVQAIIADYARRGRTTSEQGAREELVARSMEAMLSDTDAGEKIVKLKNEHRTVWNRLKSFVEKLLNAVRSLYTQKDENGKYIYDPQSAEGRMVREWEGTLQKLSDLFAKAFVETQDSYRSSTLADQADLRYEATKQRWQSEKAAKSAVEASIAESQIEAIANDLPVDTDEVTNVSDVVENSYRSFAESIGFNAFEDPETGVRYFAREDGTVVSEITEDMIRDSALGALIKYSSDMSYITPEQEAAQVKMFQELATMCVKQNDFAQAMQFVGSAIFTGMKMNADKQYGTTYDFPSICTKTQAVIDAMSAEMVKRKSGLTKSEIKDIYDKVWEMGNPVPCPECYVFSRWVGIGGLLDNIWSYQEKYKTMDKADVESDYQKMKAVIEKFAADNKISFGKAKGGLAKKWNAEYNKLTDSIGKSEEKGEPVEEDKKRHAMLGTQIETVKAMTWIDTVYFDNASHTKVNKDFYVPAYVLFNLNNGEAFAKDYKKAWAFRTTQGAGYGKAITPVAEAVLGEGILTTNGGAKFIKSKASRADLDQRMRNLFLDQKGNLDKDAKKTIEKSRLRQLAQAFLGGQRLQSTSDARYENMLDYLIATVEMQAMHSMAQVYTKVSGAVPAFNEWGFSGNMSLMPLNNGFNSKGELADTSTGGMNPSVAFELRKENPLIGTITIGVNDKHIRALMRQAVRDFIIPYHASGGDKDLIGEFRRIQDKKIAKGQMTRSNDYSRVQGEKVLKEGALKALGKTDAEIADINKFREQRIAILTGKGAIDLEYISKPGNEILKKIYDEFKVEGGRWYGAKIGKGKISEQIYPNEYWDRSLTYDQSAKIVQDYLDYCDRLGMLHKFSGLQVKYNNKLQEYQFVPVTGYDENGNKVNLTDLAYIDGKKENGVEQFFWKVLTDRRMYDNDGKYIEQQFVSLGDGKTATALSFAKNNAGSSREYSKEISDATIKELDVMNSDRNVGYHAGDLGKAESLAIQGYSRDTGHFGTGTYFVGDKERIDGSYKKRPQHAVNFDNYNLFKVRSENKGYKLHSALRAIDGGITVDQATKIMDGKFNEVEKREEFFDPYMEILEKPGDRDQEKEKLLIDLAEKHGIELEYKSYEDYASNVLEIEPGTDEYDWYRSDFSDYLEEEYNSYVEKANRKYGKLRDAFFDLELMVGFDNAKKALMKTALYYEDAAEKSYAEKRKMDSYATVFMKSAGYEGIDVRGVKGLDNTTYGSVIYDLKEDTVLYSDRDSEGNALSLEQMEYFEDSKVRDKNGNLMLMYHGTASEFYEFDKNFIGKTGAFEGTGFNFTPYELRAASYGKNVMTGYVNVSNPLSAEKKTITVSKLANLIRNVDPTGDDIIANYAVKTTDYGKSSFISRESLTTARAIWNAAENDVDIYSDLSASAGGSLSLMQAVKDLGYDGVIHYDEGGDIKTVITFDSNQFKANYNDKPTSDPDIRHSDRDERYLELAKDPEKNDAELREIVRQAAEEAGAVLDKKGKAQHFWHGTRRRQFNSFDAKKAAFGWSGIGYYFSKDKKFAESYSSDRGKLYDVYIMSNNLAADYDHNITSDDVIEFLASFDIKPDGEEVSTLGLTYDGRSYRDILNDVKRGSLVKGSVDRLVEREGDRGVILQLERLLSGVGIRNDEILEKIQNAFDVDGIYNQRETVLFDNKKVKSADPVAYDDDGNVIPLSQRFNSQNEDIRYSDRYVDLSDYEMARISSKLMSIYAGIDNGYATSQDGSIIIKNRTNTTLYYVIPSSEPGNFSLEKVIDIDIPFDDHEVGSYLQEAIIAYESSGTSNSVSEFIQAYISINRSRFHEGDSVTIYTGNTNGGNKRIAIENGRPISFETIANNRNIEIGPRGTEEGRTSLADVLGGNARKELNPNIDDSKSKYAGGNYTFESEYVSGLRTEYGKMSNDELFINSKDKNRQDYPYTLRVWVSTDGGKSFKQDTVTGLDRNHAIERANRYWKYGIVLDMDSKYEGDPREGERSYFSDRTDTPDDDRTILSNALKAAVKNEIEWANLAEYQSQITKMNEQQEKLRELKEQIRAKMFVPGGEATTEIDTLEGRIKKAKADLKASMDNEERKSIRADILELTNQLNDAKVERAKQRESEKEELKKLREQANKVANRINIYDKKLLKLEATTPLRRVVERERQKAIDLDKKKNKEFFDNYKQNVKNTQTRQRIRRLIDEINSRNFNPKVNKYVPESLVKATNEILGMINLDSQRKGERAESFRAKLAELKIKYDELKNDPKYADTVYNKTISDMIQNLAENVGDTDVYHMTSQQLQLTFNTLTALMHEIKEGVKLHNFGNAIDANTTTVQAAKMMSKELDDNKIGSDSLAAKWLQMQLRPETMFERLAGFKKDSTWMKAYRMLERGQIRQFDFERRANELFKDVMSAKDVKNGSKLYVDTLSDPKNLYDIGLRDSKNEPVKITKGMALSIYMHLQNQDNARHFANGGITVPDIKKYYKSSGDAWGTGTVVLHGISTDERLIELREEYKKLLDEKKEAKKNGDLEKEFEIENQLDVLASELHVYNEMAKDFCGKIQKNILSILDQNDKRFLRLTREYFDGLSKQELNKATMELYGFGKASVDKYFPIHTDAAFRTASFESISKDFNLENSGFMKDRIVASNPILLEDIAEVINTSIKNTARYVGLTLAIKDFSKLYGTSEKGYAGSVQESLRKKFGDPGKKYIENLLSDLVGSRNQPSTFLDRARGNMAAATLTLNVRVALGQTASFPTAAAVLGYGPIAKALSMGFKPADRALIAKWSPLLYKRTESGSSEELAGIRERAQLQNKIARSTKFLTGWIEAMDAATVGRLWYASQFYVDDNYKGLVKGSDNYYMAVAEVFNKVVEQTQPNYTVLQRPDILRNPNALVKQLTMFMTQRLQNFNILYDSVGRLRKYNADLKAGVNGVTADDVKKAKVGVANAVTSQLLATGFLVGFKLAADVITHNMNAYRDEDKELTWLSVLLKLLEDGIASLISITVGGSEIYEYGKTLITGDRYYGVSVGGLGAIEDVATSFKSITDELHKEDGQVTVSHFNKLAKSVGVFAGVPVANAEKLAMAGYHYYNDFVNDELGTFESGNNRTAKEDERRMYDAIVNGNSRVLDQYKKKYPGDKWKNEVRKLLKSQDPRIKSAAAAKNGGDYDKFYSLVKEIKAEKHFSQDEIISAVNSFITEMNKDKDSSDSEGKHKALFNKTDMENAVAAGNYDILDEMTDEIINTKMDNGDTEAKATKDTMSSLKSAIRTSVKEGKISTDQGVKLLVEFLDMSKEDAEKSLQSQAKSDIVEDYNDGLLSDSEAVSKLQSEVGLSADDAKSRVRYLTFKKNYPQYNVEESTLNRYYSDWESTGIGVESFMDFYTGTKDIKGYDKDGDGKNDAYTRIDQVIAFIAKMPISSEQKTKLLSYYWPKKYTEYRKRAPW